MIPGSLAFATSSGSGSRVATHAYPCQTSITGTFVRQFTHSPGGPLQPNGRRVVFELTNIFRYDEQGRLAEEWIQTDNRSLLRQLGAEGR